MMDTESLTNDMYSVFAEFGDVWDKSFAEGYERAILDLEVFIKLREGSNGY